MPFTLSYSFVEVLRGLKVEVRVRAKPLHGRVWCNFWLLVFLLPRLRLSKFVLANDTDDCVCIHTCCLVILLIQQIKRKFCKSTSYTKITHYHSWSSYHFKPWYQEWVDGNTHEQNLMLTHEFLTSNTSENLWMKVSERYEEYPTVKQGQLLFFKCLMDHLFSDNDEAVNAIIHKLKTFDIKNFKGEDIFRATSLVKGAVAGLKHLNWLPINIIKIVITVFTTIKVNDQDVPNWHKSWMYR